MRSKNLFLLKRGSRKLIGFPLALKIMLIVKHKGVEPNLGQERITCCKKIEKQYVFSFPTTNGFT